MDNTQEIQNPDTTAPHKPRKEKGKVRRYVLNTAIILLAVGLIYLLQHFLLGHFFPGRGKGDIIANLSYLYNKVVHRTSGDPSFKKANLDLELFEKDAVRTYDDSFSEISFLRGGSLRMDENTLIILKGLRDGLFGRPGKFSLFLEQGNIFLNLKGGEEILHYIETPNDQLVLKTNEWEGDGQVAIEIQADGTTRITGYTGKGPIDINGQTLQLNENEFFLLGENLTPEAQLLPKSEVSVTAQESPTIFTQKIGQEISMYWDTLDSAKSYVVEVSRSETFKSTLLRANTPRDYFTMKTMEEGPYFWRMRSVGEGEPTVLNGDFTIVYDDPKAWDDVLIDAQKNIVGEDTEKVTIFFQSDYPLVTFAWKPVRKAANYRLELFLDRNFEELFLAQDTKQTSYSSEPGIFRDTKYFWQVVASNASGEPIDVTEVFELNLIFDNAIPALSIYKPEDNLILKSLECPVSGILPRNASISINGQDFEVDKRGKFKGAIPVSKGTSQLIFKVTGVDDRVEYHSRTITALP